MNEPKRKNVRLIAMDLDGTLNNDRKEIDPPTREALLDAQRQGIRLLLASARPLHGLYRERDALDLRMHNGLLMAYNGGLITDADGKNILYAHRMDLGKARDILRMLETFPVTPILDDGERFYASDPDGYMVRFECRNNDMPLTRMPDPAGSLSFPPFKILMSVNPSMTEAVQQQIAPLLPSGLKIVRTAPFYLEVIPESVNKGAGLQKACAAAGTDLSETVAFGDSENDIEMLKAAGLGIAMANADRNVRDAADRVTLSNNDNGIAAALRTLL